MSASSGAPALTNTLTSVRSSCAGASEASLPSRSLICRSTVADLDLRVEDGLLRLGEALADEAEELRPVGLGRRGAVGGRRARRAAAPDCRSASSASRPPARPSAGRPCRPSASRWRPRRASARWRRRHRRCAARTCGGCRPSRSRARPSALPSTRIELCDGARRQIREQDDVVAALELDLAHPRDLGAGRKDRHRVDARGAFDVGGVSGRKKRGQHEQRERCAHEDLPCGPVARALSAAR